MYRIKIILEKDDKKLASYENTYTARLIAKLIWASLCDSLGAPMDGSHFKVS